jgi:hypothetical protein
MPPQRIEESLLHREPTIAIKMKDEKCKDCEIEATEWLTVYYLGYVGTVISPGLYSLATSPGQTAKHQFVLFICHFQVNEKSCWQFNKGEGD